MKSPQRNLQMTWNHSEPTSLNMLTINRWEGDANYEYTSSPGAFVVVNDVGAKLSHDDARWTLEQVDDKKDVELGGVRLTGTWQDAGRVN